MFTRYIRAGDTENIWKDIELRVDPDPFCTSCKISTINKKSILNKPLKPKTTFKWVFMDIITDISSKISTKDTTFANYLLTVDDYYIITKLYGIENVTTE